MSVGIVDDIANAIVRIDRMIWLPALRADPEASCEDWFDEGFVQDLPQKRAAPLYEVLPELRRFTIPSEDFPDPEHVLEVLDRAGRSGFLLRVARPVKRWDRDGLSASFTWGYYRRTWLYAANEAEIARVLVAHGEAEDAREMAEQGVVRAAEGGAS